MKITNFSKENTKHIKLEKGYFYVQVHTTAFAWSHEKYVVKKQGSFPSVILYSGTCGDSPSRDAAISMYFWRKYLSMHQPFQAEENIQKNKSHKFLSMLPGQLQKHFAFLLAPQNYRSK